MYEVELYAGWGDMDFNSHMRNTAFLDKAGDARMMFFVKNGFPMSELARFRIGPVIVRDEIEYRGEIRLLDQFKVTVECAGMSSDGSRFRIRNRFLRSDGRESCVVTSTGGWLSLESRKLVAPPEALLNAMRSLGLSEDFEVLPTSVRGA